MDQLGEIRRDPSKDDPDWGIVPSESTVRARAGIEERDDSGVDLPDRSPAVETDNPVFVPPFIGSRVIKGISLDDIAAYLNETALFRNQWGFRPENGENDEDVQGPPPPRAARPARQGPRRRPPAVPQLVYGYWPANGDGTDLVVWEDESRRPRSSPASRSPRSRKEPYLCIADFFRPLAVDGPSRDRLRGVP